MPVDMAALTADLTAESAELDEILTALSLAQWDIATPAVSWTVKDQVTHLAWFDEAAVTAAREPDRFREEAARLGDAVGGLADRIAPQYRAMPPADVLAWFRDTRQRYVDAFAALAPDTRLPWYGPPMSAASSVTARLMETWAHGQDVVDAIGATRQPTDRLRHIAHLGVRTLGWSFRVHGQLEPNMPVRVELDAPGGGRWTWGPKEAMDRVTGSAEDFCLLVTQRRHRDQTALVAQGAVADAWLDVAQAFAGPPGRGRPAPL